VDEDKKTKDEKKRMPVVAETFKEAKARQLNILPPTFTEKNL